MPSRVTKGAAVAAIAISLISTEEGLRTYAYRDPVGIPTICFGETRGVYMGQHKTPAECKDMLSTRLIEFSRGVDKCIVHIERVPDYTYAAVVSLSYNIGTGAFCKSTIARLLNAGDIKGACNHFTDWEKARGIRLPGLVRRREEEKALCLKGLA